MKHSRVVVAAGALTLLAAVSPAQENRPPAGMMRFPDVSASHIVFSYANDLWLVSRDGGEARPLASPPGGELFPRFNDDGTMIAFIGNYDGDRDVYTIPVAGGAAFRVTYHPANESLSGWTPDGDIIFSSNGLVGQARQSQLFTVSPGGGLPEALPVPYGSMGSISGDGVWLAYTPSDRDFRTWKRYAGGLASDIWLFNLETRESRRATDWIGTDTQPMWHNGKLYYLSDAGDEERLNIWMFNPNTGDRRQLTDFDEFDCKFASVGPGERGRGEIVFQNGPSLYLYDIARDRSRMVDIVVPGDRPKVRKHTVMAGENMAGAAVSATGKRGVIEARGDIWTVPAENGSPRQITDTSGAAERYPAWSPDGRWISYVSDETGEYEVYITQSDGLGETRQLTEGSETFYYGATWSPDSETIAYADKAGNLYLTEIGTGDTTFVEKEPWANPITPSWSRDSRYLTYAMQQDESITSVVKIYDTESGESLQVTSGFFSDSNPVFSRDGKWLYYASARDFTSPTYEDVGSTFVYNQTSKLIAVPLNDDVEHPFAAESDEETWEEDDEDDADEDDSDDGDDDESDNEADAKGALHGTWEATITGLSAIPSMTEDELTAVMEFVDNGDGTYSGESTSQGETEAYDSIEFDEGSGKLVATRSAGPVESRIEGTVSGDEITGTWNIKVAAAGIDASGSWTATRTDEEPSLDAEPEEKVDDDAPVEIDVENFEMRGIELPASRGNIGALGSNDKGHVLYMLSAGGLPAIKLMDLGADEPEEKTVLSPAMGYSLSGDGKKLGAMTPVGLVMVSASPGQSAGSSVDISNLRKRVDPREEWRQIARDAWRRHRDFFYVENMHGVDWDGVWDRYSDMIDHATSREDISFIIGEMIGELNVGHAYYWGGDTEDQPSVNVGMLAADYEVASIPADLADQVEGDLPDEAYRITTIHHGAPWDSDARGPLSQPGVGIDVGDFLLAINGAPIETDRDPWAAFEGLAGETVTLTILDATPEEDDANEGDGDDAEGEADDDEVEIKRDEVITLTNAGQEAYLRYRAWVEANRRMVDELSDGRIGYIYVPNTGVQGQNELFRQFFGQSGKEALLIDERWNGGGQIPNRFIELLDRPRTNYWYRRDGKDWPWPYDSHQGPKAMLINGAAGSGGDMFPWLFKHHELGKLIGTRTWGGLVGISGVPGLVDGGYTAVPNFGFYEKDGTWGIEGHGVDPDIEVIDDPAKMQNGRDPQIETAVDHLLAELETEAYEAPKRPKPPVRTGIGISERDK